MFPVAGGNVVSQAVAADRAFGYLYFMLLPDGLGYLGISVPGYLLPRFDFGEYEFGHDTGEVVVRDFRGPAGTALAIVACYVVVFAVAKDEVGGNSYPVLLRYVFCNFRIPYDGSVLLAVFGLDGYYVFAHDNIQFAVLDLPRPASPDYCGSSAILILCQCDNPPVSALLTPKTSASMAGQPAGHFFVFSTILVWDSW